MSTKNKTNNSGIGISLALMFAWVAYLWGEINGMMSISDLSFKEAFSKNFSKIDFFILGLFILSISLTAYKAIKSKKQN